MFSPFYLEEMKNYWSLNVSRAVSQVIMQVHKPKVEYKLALQEKPQGSILTYYYKTNNLTRINWLNTRLIIASNKIRHEIPFKTKRVKYTAIWKKSIKIDRESRLSFLRSFPPHLFLFPPLQFYYFRSSFLNSLLHKIKMENNKIVEEGIITLRRENIKIVVEWIRKIEGEY